MYESIRAGERSWYIDCPAKIGICLLDGADVCLIDSGNDRDAGKRALRILEGERVASAGGRQHPFARGPYRRKPVSAGTHRLPRFCSPDRGGVHARPAPRAVVPVLDNICNRTKNR
ncbi:MAG: hypothetical protein V8T86_06160, partial [Victivallis sp.]